MPLLKKLSIIFYRWAWKIKPIDKEQNTTKNNKQGEQQK